MRMPLMEVTAVNVTLPGRWLPEQIVMTKLHSMRHLHSLPQSVTEADAIVCTSLYLLKSILIQGQPSTLAQQLHGSDLAEV